MTAPVPAVPVAGSLPRPRAEAPSAGPGALPTPLPSVVFLSGRELAHPEGGGSELYLDRITTGLAARGHAVTVFTADHGCAPRDEVRDGVRFVRRGGRLTVYLRGLLGLRSGLLGRPDVVVDIQNGMTFLSPLVTRRPVVNVVHHVHREQWPVVFGPFMSRLGWWIESRLAPKVYRRSRYVVVSDATAREVVGLGVGAERVQVVHNGSDPARLTGAVRSSTPLIAVLGRLVPHKRVELAMRAVAELRAELPELRLVVMGQGWWDDKLRQAAAELGVEDAVDFLGFVDEGAKHAVLTQSWVLAQPSLKEGWGLSVVEAASHGTPAVAFADAGGLTDSIRDGETGLLVDSPEEFVQAIRRLLVDEVLRARLGHEARAHAADYTWEGAVTSFTSLLSRLAPAARGG